MRVIVTTVNQMTADWSHALPRSCRRDRQWNVRTAQLGGNTPGEKLGGDGDSGQDRCMIILSRAYLEEEGKELSGEDLF